MSNKKIIIGNWKMAPGNVREAKTVFQKIRTVAGKLRSVQTVVCVPHVFITDMKKLVTGHRCVVGAQDVSFETDDPHTGEVSVDMLKSAGVSYVIVGHSERRAKGETNADILKKTLLVTKKGMYAVLCVGESTRDNEGRYTAYVKEQLLAVIKGLPAQALDKLIVAYEPVWAIGANAKKEASAEDVIEMAIFIRKILIDTLGDKKGAQVPVLYGGSVDPNNAAVYLNECGMDGLLVGRVSLKPALFEKIMKNADH